MPTLGVLDTTAATLTGEMQARLDTLVIRFVAELPDPPRVRLIIADDFPRAAAKARDRAVEKSNDEPAPETYNVQKPDGAVTVALTVNTAEGVDVVLPTALLQIDDEIVDRTVLHEAQHVRLHQHAGSAFAAHRRVPGFDTPDDLAWEFLWLAENAVDEYRCELSLYNRELADVEPPNGGELGELEAIVANFDAARASYQRRGDLMRLYHTAFQVLQRLGVFLADTAARIVTGPDELVAPWRSEPSVRHAVALLREMPDSGSAVSDEDLTAVAVQFGRQLRQALRVHGRMDYYFVGGRSQRYLKVLR
ncbi:MAG TPA: hypothetical protein VGM91_04215 [Conexibacter sp.]|jgi:hypothetical protein